MARMPVITVGRVKFQTGSVQYFAVKTRDTFFGGDIGAISWITTEELEGGYFVQWIGVDDESEILPALHSEKFKDLLSSERAEQISIEIHDPGEMRIIQAAEIGDDLVAPSIPIKLRPGTYDATSVYLETPSLMIVVRKLTLQ